MSTGHYLLHVIFAEGVPLCVSTAGSMSRAVVCIAGQSVPLCPAYQSTPITCNLTRTAYCTKVCSTGAGLRPCMMNVLKKISILGR